MNVSAANALGSPHVAGDHQAQGGWGRARDGRGEGAGRIGKMDGGGGQARGRGEQGGWEQAGCDEQESWLRALKGGG